MAYILFSLSVVFLVLTTILYFTRNTWLPLVSDLGIRLPHVRVPFADYVYSRLSPSTFEDDIEAGLSSGTFDLAGNVEAGDSRSGLDGDAKREVLRIMKKRRMNFDQARKVYLENRFKANGIGADGRPRDPKFVSFS